MKNFYILVTSDYNLKNAYNIFKNRIKRNIESKAAETSRLMAATPEQVAKHVAEAKRLMAEARLKNTGMRGAGGSGLDFRDANK
jgi:uncharacterized protein YajQ (UPF0234 family)